MSKNVIILIIIMIIVALIGGGLAGGIYYILEKNDENDTIQSLHPLEEEFGNQLASIVNLYAYTLNVVIQINEQSDIIYDPLQSFIDFTAIRTSELFYLSNELKYIPIVYNISEFEDLASVNIKPNFTIVDPVFSTMPTTFVPVPDNRNYYCPLSYLSPNRSVAFFDFVGVDVCNQTSWEVLISKMLVSNLSFVVEPRFVGRTSTFTLDVGKRVNNSSGDIIAFVVHSFFIDIFAYNTLDAIFPNYSNDSIAIKIDEFGKTIFKHDTFDLLSEQHVFVISQKLTEQQSLNITFKYSNNYFDSFNSNNNVITLIIILLLFSIVDFIIVLFYVLYNRKQDRDFYSKLERQNSYVSKMINYVNHEIRNPLNSIIGMVDLTRMDIDQLDIQEKSVLISNLDTVYNSGLLIQHIVNDVLDIRKLEQGKLELRYNCVNLKHFSEQLLKLLAPKIQEYPHLDFYISCKIDNVYIDSIRLNQILLNLISNSFKFTSEGFIHVNITNYNDETILFEVIDSGCGVPKEYQKLLFHPFEQVKTNVISRQVGYGLGLYLCKMLVTLMNGEIGMKTRIDEEGKEDGSIFWFTLPKERCEIQLSMSDNDNNNDDNEMSTNESI